MYIVGKRIYLGKRKIYKVWNPYLNNKIKNNEVLQELLPYMKGAFFLMNQGELEAIMSRDKVESKLKDIEENIEIIQASPSSKNLNIHINLNLNDVFLSFFKLPKLKNSPKNVAELIDIKHNLEKIIARCSYYLFVIQNLNESLEVFNDEEKVRILGALFQFRDSGNPYAHYIAVNLEFKHDAKNWGFTGKEADFSSHDDRVSCFIDDIENRFRLVKIDDKNTFSLDDFDEYLRIYINIFKKYAKDYMIY